MDRRGRYTVITEPTAEPVSLSEVKEALRITFNDHDALLSGYIVAARKHAEAFTGLRILSQTIDVSYDCFPGDVVELYTWPISSISSVNYYDTGSPATEQTLVVNTDYYADTTTPGGRVCVIDAWPAVADQPNAVRIRLVAGYADAELVPQTIKEAIKLHCHALYYGDDLMASVRSMLWLERLDWFRG